jgi:acyl-CoA thioesterase I
MSSRSWPLVRGRREGELLLLGLGDSLTYGWEVERGFFDRAVDLLAGMRPETSVRRLNAGVPGDTAHGGLARLAPLLRREPDLAVVQFGLNDAFLGVPVASYAAALAAIVERCRDADVTPLLATSCALANPRDGALVEPFYTAIREVAERTGTAVAALHSHWQAHAAPGLQHHNADGVHPNDRGHALMAEGLVAALSIGAPVP